MAKKPIANKAEVMSDTDLAQTIMAFIESQAKQNAEFRKDIAQNSKETSKLTAVLEGLFKDKEYLFGFHNENVTERLRSGKEQWKTVLQGLGVAAVIMGAILGPLVANITANKTFVAMLSANQSDIKTNQAVIEMKQYYSDVINGIERDHQGQIDGAWVDEGGNVAHRARRIFYTPQEPR